MTKEQSTRVFGGAATLPLGQGTAPAGSAPAGSIPTETAPTGPIPAASMPTGSAPEPVDITEADAARQETVGPALAAPVPQDTATERKTTHQLIIVCALAMVCGLAGGIAGGAAATAAGLGASSSTAMSMNGGPGGMGGAGGAGGMDGGAGAPDGMDAGGNAAEAPDASGGQDGSAAGTDRMNGSSGTDDGAGQAQPQAPDADTGAQPSDTDDESATQANGALTSEVYNA